MLLYVNISSSESRRYNTANKKRKIYCNSQVGQNGKLDKERDLVQDNIITVYQNDRQGYKNPSLVWKG